MRTSGYLRMLLVVVGLMVATGVAFADTCSGPTSTDASGQAVCNLSASGSSGTINGGIFSVQVGAPTGTGVFDPFLRVDGHSLEYEAGWNEDYKNPADSPTNALNDPHTHPLSVGNLASVTCPGGVNTCYEFILDLQQANPTLISLNNVQIFVGSNPEPSDNGCNATNFATCIPTNGDALVWNMDAGSGGDSSVTLDSAIHQGQGLSNMTLYVPTALFSGNGYLIFYTQFGTPPGQYESNSAFEEWAALTGPGTPVPEPGSLMLLGTGLVTLGGMIRRRRKQ